MNNREIRSRLEKLEERTAMEFFHSPHFLILVERLGEALDRYPAAYDKVMAALKKPSSQEPGTISKVFALVLETLQAWPECQAQAREGVLAGWAELQEGPDGRVLN